MSRDRGSLCKRCARELGMIALGAMRVDDDPDESYRVVCRRCDRLVMVVNPVVDSTSWVASVSDG